MEKTINVGGRLHNPVVGGSLTGANEIKDDIKGKTQSVINQETDAELVRLDEAKQNNLTFDQTPTENSTNPVTSGGVYAADAALQQAIEAILLLIPSAATALNQLADKSFVNSSIATATATFRGTYNLVTDLELTVSATHQQIATALASVVSTADNNDYCFVQIPVSDQSTDIRVTERYKFDGTSWEYEYDLNNSGFTADQWGAINSGITSVLVSKLGALPTAAELATLFNGKQNTLTFDNAPVAGSDNPVKSSGLYNAFAAINAMIPEGADANNKLVAESRLVAYVTTLINALDATFDVTSADGHVTLRMTQADGVITSVQILTSDIASDAALTSLGGRVSTAEADIDALQDAYAALTQSDVVIVNGALPSSGQQQNIIYRQPDQDHTPPQFYSDYMWNGTTWVLMATYNNAIDPRPKKGSQNLVTSGGVFDNMGALDVSELNATENPHTLATYADLSAALAAIPSDYQKGGMSIKFVQSSDNKYVQYRLMSDTFNTTVANWQGVDNVPTTGSDNLVKSGGIVNYLVDTFGNNIETYNQTVEIPSSQSVQYTTIFRHIKLRNEDIIIVSGVNDYFYINYSDGTYQPISPSQINKEVKVVIPEGKEFVFITATIPPSSLSEYTFKIKIYRKNIIDFLDEKLYNLTSMEGNNISIYDEDVSTPLSDAVVNNDIFHEIDLQNGDLFFLSSDDSECYFMFTDGSFQHIVPNIYFEVEIPNNKELSYIRVRVPSSHTGEIKHYTAKILSKEWIVASRSTGSGVSIPPIKALILGDSYSVDGGYWASTMIEKLPQGSSFISLAVASATLKDKYSDRETYPYTDRPTSSDNSGNHNTLACQIQKLKRLMAGTDLDVGESAIYQTEDSYPNVIIIAGGKNDSYDTDSQVDTYNAQLNKVVNNVYIKRTFSDENLILGSATIKTPIDEVDRTCFAGAYRYLFDELLNLFPNAHIYIATVSPISNIHDLNISSYFLRIANHQRLCADIFGATVIDWYRDGQINLIANYTQGSGTENDPYVWGECTLPYADTYDHLHPNERGGRKYGICAAHAIINTFIEIE